MHPDSKRAERRAQRQRKAKRVADLIRRTWLPISRFAAPEAMDPQPRERATYLRIDNYTKCSCWMCGNPRKYGRGAAKLTLAEMAPVYLDKEDQGIFASALLRSGGRVLRGLPL